MPLPALRLSACEIRECVASVEPLTSLEGGGGCLTFLAFFFPRKVENEMEMSEKEMAYVFVPFDSHHPQDTAQLFGSGNIVEDIL